MGEALTDQSFLEERPRVLNDVLDLDSRRGRDARLGHRLRHVDRFGEFCEVEQVEQNSLFDGKAKHRPLSRQ